MGALRFDPNAPQTPPPASTTGSGSGVRFDPNAQTTTGGDPGGATTTGAAQPSGWGIDWSTPWSQGGPSLKQPQSFQDFSDVASNEAFMNTLPGLRARADAARQRMDPVTAASAGMVGNIVSPTSVLNAVPYVGPELAGAAHEGIKSYAQGNDWKTIGEDTLGGGVSGLAGQGVAKAAPIVAPAIARGAFSAGGPVASTWLSHNIFGHGDITKELMGASGSFGLLPLFDEFGKRAQAATQNAISSPAAQQAIKSLILGGGSAARQYAGPYDQWIPGQ